MSIPAGAGPANAAAAAAKRLGINFKIFDAKLNVGGGNAAAFRAALASNPNAIIIHGISCADLQQPLREAKAAGVKVMGVESLDCSPKLYSTEMKYSPKAVTGEDYFTAWGKVAADYIISATNGKAKIINNPGTEPLQVATNKGFTDELKKCSGCTIVDTLTWNNADLTPGGPWVQRLRAAVVQHPDANAVFLPYDPNIILGGPVVSKALPKAVSVGGSGEAPEIELVRQGKVTAITSAHDGEWMGWGAMDNINRALNGQDTAPEGIGFLAVDANHNLPPSGKAFKSPTDFKAAYEKSWGQ
jgi:ribose transport system substrate-binding protein